jgi:hypothetical protein
MMSYGQNEELTVEDLSPLVAENRFIGAKPNTAPLPVFEEIKDMLPQPVWAGHEDVIACYYKAWEIAFSNLRQPKENTGFVSPFIDTAFNGCTFMWDSAFMLMFGKYADRIFKFQGTLDNFYSHQHRDGFICREIEEDTGREHFTRHDPSATGPEVMSWCEWVYFENFGDKERLAKVFSPLLAYHRWMKDHHTWPDGSYFSSGWGCGMDNIPRLEEGYDQRKSHGHMVWVDVCMQALLDCKNLAKMAKVLEKPEFLPELEAEAAQLEKLINEKLWDEGTGFYYDLLKNGKHNMARHIGAFWGLIADCIPKERAERMVSLLEDEKEFKTPLRIPALTQNHPGFVPDGRYWRGGVWASTNYMALSGLTAYCYPDLAHRIAGEHLQAVVNLYKQEGTLYECYAPTGLTPSTTAKGNPVRKDFVGWTGLVPISVLFEFVFGIRADVQNRVITWDVRLTEKHGIKSYPFGADGWVELQCDARCSADDRPVIHCCGNVPVTIRVLWGKDQAFDIAI